MRNAFAAEITQLAAQDERIVLLSGDIGNRLFNPFKDVYPERFLNCGVAEANMTSMAAAMALSGLRPLCYTIAPFATTRCLEQIRIDVCYHNQPVIIVGVGAGLSYASDGPTHHACEDIAFLRSLPNMTVICPADAVEVRLALREALQLSGPVYLRLGKKNEPVVHRTAPEFSIGRAITLRQGHDVCLVATGTILPEALAAAENLQGEGISAQVVSMHTVKPLDIELLSSLFSQHRVVVTVEEHNRNGGLGGAVAEWRADNPNARATLVRLGTDDRFYTTAGKQSDARSFYGLDSESIALKTLDALFAAGPKLVSRQHKAVGGNR